MKLVDDKKGGGMGVGRRALMRITPVCLALAGLFAAGNLHAALILPTGINVSVPSGSNNPASGAYTDDVYLTSLVFPDVTFATSASFSAVQNLEVTDKRGNINAEWGDADTASDGDDNPFSKAGLDPDDQESTDPAIQDPALINAFNGLSLSEMSDGEGGGFQFKVLFQDGLVDNDPSALDGVPELVFFERGRNDQFSVEAIIGGTFDNPVYSGSFAINSGDFWGTGIHVNTVEIGSSQEIGAAGIDLNDFGLGAGAIIYGFRLTSTQGPDLNGFFLSTEDGENFLPPLEDPPGVPLPPTFLLVLAGCLGMGGVLRRCCWAKPDLSGAYPANRIEVVSGKIQ